MLKYNGSSQVHGKQNFKNKLIWVQKKKKDLNILVHITYLTHLREGFWIINLTRGW